MPLRSTFWWSAAVICVSSMSLSLGGYAGSTVPNIPVPHIPVPHIHINTPRLLNKSTSGKGSCPPVCAKGGVGTNSNPNQGVGTNSNPNQGVGTNSNPAAPPAPWVVNTFGPRLSTQELQDLTCMGLVQFCSSQKTACQAACRAKAQAAGGGLIVRFVPASAGTGLLRSVVVVEGNATPFQGLRVLAPCIEQCSNQYNGCIDSLSSGSCP
jgi:hypothetical protein